MPIRFFRFVVLLLVAITVAVQAPPVHAQNGATTQPDVVTGQQQVIAKLTSRIDALEKDIAAEAQDDAQLVEIRTQLEEIGRELLESGVAFRPRLNEINTRLGQLGAPPAEGQPPEPEVVSSERQSLSAQKAEINALLGQAEDQSIRVNRLVGNIVEIRRELFQSLLTKRYDINLTLLGEVASASSGEATRFYRTVSSWLRFVIQYKWQSVLAATFFALLVAVVLFFGGRRLFGGLFDPDPLVEEPSYLGRLSVAFWSTLLPTMAVSAFLVVTYFLYDYFGVLRTDISAMLATLFFVIGIVFFVDRLGRAVFSPDLPNWRLIDVDTRAARLLHWLVFATAFFTGIDYFLGSIYQVQSSPLALTVGESLITTVLTGSLVVMIGLVKPSVDEDGRPRRWPALLRYSLFLLGGVTIAASLLGYLGFARFLSTQIVVTGAVLATMYIGFLSSRAMSDEGAFVNTRIGGRLGTFFKLDEATVDQLGVVISIAVNIFVLIIGLPLIMILWGFQFGDITAFVYRFATGIQIGSFTLSLTGILTGIVVFIVGYFLTRWFQGWLDGSVMARGKVDAGVRNSIRTAVGYAGVALAGLIGVSAAGIDLSNLALVAGALSLGIGFGLQNVVSNFVSGLILLAERPFKAGDWIVAGAVSGTVKKISVRATEIETFQRQTVILPNSELINSAVGNWTHKNRLGRIDIRVNIAYGSDARRAHEVMTQIAGSHPLVLKNPEPFVLFLNFGPAALEFEIRLFVADILSQNSVLNDIRFAILEAFDRENIEIPSTPRAVIEKASNGEWPHDDDKADAELMEYKDKAAAQVAAAAAQRGKGRSRTRKPDPDLS
ncbi:MAG TPA: mechanosensitive ion channel family protein [Rhizobiaceae bacterium]|nr:mechanosensitive ion channel family protein [Rhizobiaceae bacterium]